MFLYNLNPTRAELEMFYKSGLYLFSQIEGDITYVPIKTELYPIFEKELSINIENVDFKNGITFDLKKKKVSFIGNIKYDLKLLNIVLDRCIELGFKYEEVA